MTKEEITAMLLTNEELSADVRELAYKVADLTEVVELLTREIAK
tara:strand:+ start:293 stop:424 length:132 start_codon:yes stop_codon:yes gene_type:complete